MKKKYLITLFFMLSTSILSFAQTTIAVIPFTGGTDDEGEIISRLLGTDLVKESKGSYAIVQRSVMDRILEEQKFQRNGLVDAGTIAKLGNIANAKYVVTGHIKKIGNKNLVIASMTEIKTLHQTAGYYSYYNDLSEMIELKIMAQTLINNTKKNTGSSSKILAVFPFEISRRNQASKDDAETLAQILACSLANNGKYKIVLRTSTLERVMAEYKIQETDLTSSENVQKVGNALGADCVLAGSVSTVSGTKLMDVQIFDVETGYQIGGDKETYNTVDDGINIMVRLSTKLTTTQTAKNVSSTSTTTTALIATPKPAQTVAKMPSSNTTTKTATTQAKTITYKEKYYDYNHIYGLIPLILGITSTSVSLGIAGTELGTPKGAFVLPSDINDVFGNKIGYEYEKTTSQLCMAFNYAGLGLITIGIIVLATGNKTRTVSSSAFNPIEDLYIEPCISPDISGGSYYGFNFNYRF